MKPGAPFSQIMRGRDRKTKYELGLRCGNDASDLEAAREQGTSGTEYCTALYCAPERGPRALSMREGGQTLAVKRLMVKGADIEKLPEVKLGTGDTEPQLATVSVCCVAFRCLPESSRLWSAS